MCNKLSASYGKLKYKSQLAIILLCSYFNSFSQNLIPNPGFEAVIANTNDVSNIWNTNSWTGFGSIDWFHQNNINPLTGNSCNSPYCTSAPKNYFGRQLAHTGQAYAGFYSYFRNSFSAREMIFVPLTDSLDEGKAYCVSFYVSLADTANYAHSLLSALFVKDSIYMLNQAVATPMTFTDYFAPQITNSSGFLSSKTDWMHVEEYFVADSAYKYMFIGEFTNIIQHDTLYVPGGMASLNPFAYYYVDDVSVVWLKKPAKAAVSDTLQTTLNTVIQLGSNVGSDATYQWWPADNLSNATDANPNLLVTQSAWYYVQKTQCKYVTYDSVYVQANPVGINEYSVSNNLYTLQPNPNNGEFVLQNKLNKTITGTLFIYDSQGALVEEIPLKEQNTIRVKLNNCKGIYFLRLVDENNTTVYLGKTLIE